MIATETQPAPPTTKDARIRHYVQRLSPKGEVPVVWSKIALCGTEIQEVFVDQNGEICQACVDESRRRPVET